jgi:urate oxidase
MSAVLKHSTYGKSHVRLTKVTRHASHHDLKELRLSFELEGDFDASYTQGDNRQVIATDTMKNTAYALARNHLLVDLEGFGLALASHFMKNFGHVSASTIRLVEQPWQRIVANGRDHPHAFTDGGREKPTSKVKLTQQTARIESGINDLFLLKTTDSAFKAFLRDAYTTLRETDDRIFATCVRARWIYREGNLEWNHCRDLIRRTLLETFAQHKSRSVQQTLHAMGAAALQACDQIQQITLVLPNQHHIPVDLQPFGLDNPNVIFVPMDEPYGLIRATLSRT